MIRADPDGSYLRIRDVATVDLGAKVSDVTASFDGRPTAMIGVYHAPGANAIAAGDGVQGRDGPARRRSFPAGIGYAIVYDTTAVRQGERSPRSSTR